MQTRRFVLSPVKKLLFERGISQSQAAKDLKTDYFRFNRIVNGWTTASPELRRKIATYFGVPESELFVEQAQAGQGSPNEERIPEH